MNDLNVGQSLQLAEQQQQRTAPAAAVAKVTADDAHGG